MASLTLRLPKSTHEQLKALAGQEGVSINQLALTAVAEKISALRSTYLFESLKEPVSRQAFEAALAEVPNSDPDPWDVWTKSRTRT
jgi:hypothetical protein